MQSDLAGHETGDVLCGTGDSGLPAGLYKVAQAWKDRKEAGTARCRFECR